jgi:hypothetical protein
MNIYCINTDGYTLAGYRFRRSQHRKKEPTKFVQGSTGGGVEGEMDEQTDAWATDKKLLHFNRFSR